MCNRDGKLAKYLVSLLHDLRDIGRQAFKVVVALARDDYAMCFLPSTSKEISLKSLTSKGES